MGIPWPERASSYCAPTGGAYRLTTGQYGGALSFWRNISWVTGILDIAKCVVEKESRKISEFLIYMILISPTQVGMGHLFAILASRKYTDL